MNIETAVLTLAAVVAGGFIALQSPINAAMAMKLGNPIAGATWSFIVGTVALIVLSLLLARGSTNASALLSMSPLLIFGGGLLGATFVTSNILLTPRIGVAAVVALAIAGQVIASLILDRYGFLGMTVREISPARFIGAAMVVGGALMVRFL